MPLLKSLQINNEGRNLVIIVKLERVRYLVVQHGIASVLH